MPKPRVAASCAPATNKNRNVLISANGKFLVAIVRHGKFLVALVRHGKFFQRGVDKDFRNTGR